MSQTEKGEILLDADQTPHRLPAWTGHQERHDTEDSYSLSHHVTTFPKSQDKKLSTSVCVDTEGSHDSCGIKISQSNGDRFKIVYTVKMYWLTQNKRSYLNTCYSIGSVLESDYFLQKTQLIVTKEIHRNCRCGYRCRTHIQQLTPKAHDRLFCTILYS